MEKIKRIQLSEIAEFITKGTTPTTIGYEFQNEGVNFLKIECFDEKGGFIENKVAHISEECHEKLKRSQLKAGDILFSIAGAIGRVAIITEEILPANTNQALAIIRITDEQIYLPYVKLILTSPIVIEQFEKKKQGVAQLNLSLKDINELFIPLPSKEKQIELAELFDKVANAITMRNVELTALDNLIKARFIELFGDPMSEDSKWGISTIGDQFDVTSGGTPATGEKAYWDNGTIPWIGSNMCQDTILCENDGKFITEEGYAHSSAKWFYRGTVLVALVGATIGKTALLRFDTTTNQNIAAIDVNGNAAFSSEFVFYHMQMLYTKFMEIGSGKFKMANQGFIRQLPLICPPLELQEQFAAFVEQTNKSKVVVQAALEKAQLLFDSLMQQYFG